MDRPLILACLLVTSGLVGCLDTGDEPVETSSRGAGSGGFSETGVFPGDYDTTGLFSEPLEQGPYALEEPAVVNLTSEVDGGQLQIGLVHPDVPDGVETPVVAVGSPYFYEGLDPEGIEENWRHLVFAENLVPHGYTLAFVPVRGTADQAGCMDLMGPREQADLSQAVTWLGEQGFSNGNVGMIGLSYGGSTPWEVAAAGNPHLETIVPISGLSDLWHQMYHNGTVQFFGPGGLNAYYYTFGFAFYNPVDGTRSAERSVDAAVCPQSFEGIAAAGYSSAAIERDPTGFWAERNHRPEVEANYDGSVFLVQGLDDWRVPPSQSYPWVNELAANGTPVKHLLGQWDHSLPDLVEANGEDATRWDWAEILLHWFDYWLKEDTSVDLGPRVQVQDSEGRWRSEQAWPPDDAEPTTFHLAPDGELAREPTEASESVTVGPDPNDRSFVEAAEKTAAQGGVGLAVPGGPEHPCPPCPTFELGPLEEDLRLAGVPKVHLSVTPAGPGGHVTAFLLAVGEDGAETIGRGGIDLRVADGSPPAEPVVPGRPLTARMVLEPLDAVVPAGERLVLMLTQGAYEERLPTLPTYPVRVQVGGEASTVTAKTFERGPGAFFEPPSTGDADRGGR